MALIDTGRQPSRLEMRIFGMLFAAFFGLLGAVTLWKTGVQRAAVVLWAAGGVVGLVYYIVPSLRWPIYTVWTRATSPLGWIVSHAVMGLIFYGVLTPFGVIMRLVGHDPMQRRLRAGEATYWVKLERSAPSRYFRQS